jgi:uncharacterized protein (TIGR04255 family)
MSGSEFKLSNPPIVEAILDIDCDLPPGQQLAALEEPAHMAFRDRYPKISTQFVQEHRLKAQAGEPPQMSLRQGVQAYRFHQQDGKQLVQVRVQGFSFNRLAPYTSLDDYLPEIERTWRLYVHLASPLQVRVIRLRFINRILLPFTENPLELNDYFRAGPRLPDEQTLTLLGFFLQHTAMEVGTGHEAAMVLTAQPRDGNRLPVIFDNCVAAAGPGEATDWDWIHAKIRALRDLKNRIFRNMLTERCLNLFQP